jgi:RimJ/RimL family protein N-acetyltransferase
LSGAEYAIVNETFRRTRQHALARRNGGPVERILVSFGQIDELNATSRALAALTKAGFSGDIDVVLGHAAPHLRAVKAEARPQTRVHVDTGDMAALMTKADLAIGAGGVSALERCCLGLPSVLLTVAENQRGIVAMLKKAGAAIDVGEVDHDIDRRLTERVVVLFADRLQRVAMAHAGAKLVDGRGLERVMFAAIGSVSTKKGGAVSLRPATAADETRLLQLQTSRETRRYFRNFQVPTSSEHREWMHRTLNDSARLLVIIECDGVAVGMIRLDRLPGEHSLPHYEVSIAVEPGSKRHGIGMAALSLVRRLAPSAIFEATIMPQNSASISLFSRSGFVFAGNHLYRSFPQ